MNTPKVSLLEHNQQVIEQALSPLNMWGTGEEFKHPPNRDTREGQLELIEHHIHSGATQRLSSQHEIVTA